MPLGTFARHCQLIAASGRQAMSVSGYVNSLSAANAAGPGMAGGRAAISPDTETDTGNARPDAAASRGPLVLTIDDGGGTTMSALRLLVEFGLTATVFLTSSRVGDPGYFHRTDLHRIRGLGIEIGGSGHTGRPLNELARSDVIAELTLSRRRLAGAIGDEPRTFAYPGGGYDLSVRQLVISAGYSSACAVRDVLSHPDDDRFALARLAVDAATPDSRLVAWLGGFGHSEPPPVHAADRLFRMGRMGRMGRTVGPFRPRLGRAADGIPVPVELPPGSTAPAAASAPAGSAEPAALQTVGDSAPG
ncbi:Polysaccharide deacetylase [Frankia sp. AiPs1]|uniref:polysaccharide deacetylase family protein n=1 Tax=Frankia sp. AiPa1 TaxID=573492 RepID=UPI00202B6614|nr:polysaccharide deacetylase family protein [Frankia sp. AiPa1]MCL9758302.1 polysaccharide deacetylase family protein [Frankia sp. AiPa1]